MADDQSQRPYRASEPPPARSAGKPSGNDPLAELARLIGQTDPFAEFGRDSARRAAPPQPSERTEWSTQPLGTPRSSPFGDERRPSASPSRYAGNGYYAPPSASEGQPSLQDYAGQNYARQSYGDTPLPGSVDQYPMESDAPAYASDAADYQQDAYENAQQVDDAYYEDAPPSRRRLGIMAIAGVLVLAVIGTAGAFGYRVLFGSSGSSKVPPVIKADTGPSKIVPATNAKDGQSSKLITDRVNERGQSEKLVSREEQPLDKPTTVVLSQNTPQPLVGSGVLASEPKKIRTIAIHPDQPVVADAAQPSGALVSNAPVRSASPASPVRAAPPVQTARGAPPDNATVDSEQEAPSAPAPRPSPSVRQAAPASTNAPLSLNPDAAPTRAPAAARPAAAPTHIASAPPQTAQSSGSYVQVSSQRSEAEAEAAYRSLQAKFPTQLGGRSAQVHKADLGAKGIYYRAMVGPFANAAEASQLCASLKAAGGQCLIQRN
jgi:sporulation related protein